MIIGESALEPGEMKEGDAYSSSNDPTHSSSNNEKQQSTATKSETESEVAKHYAVARKCLKFCMAFVVVWTFKRIIVCLYFFHDEMFRTGQLEL